MRSRTVSSLLTAICISLTVPVMTGCAAAIPVLTQIAAVVTDAFVVLQIIDRAATEWFQLHPHVPPEVRAEFERVYQKALLALNAAQRAIAGSTELSQREYEAAFADFKQAYYELLQLLQREGIARADRTVLVGTSQTVLPEPLALTYQVELE